MLTVLPNNEAARREVLQRYQILDTPPETRFDQLARLAAQLCQVPFALISFMDGDRQWLKSRIGFDVEELNRQTSFCHSTLSATGAHVIEDIDASERYQLHLHNFGLLHARFYAGVPLVVSEGVAIGTLAVLDQQPRSLTPAQVESLQAIAHQITALLELRKHTYLLQQSIAYQRQIEVDEDHIFNASSALLCTVDRDGTIDRLNPQWEQVLGTNASELMAQPLGEWVHPDDRAVTLQSIAQATAGTTAVCFESRLRTPTGSYRWLSWTVIALLSRPGVYAIAHDITPQKTSDISLQQVLRELEELKYALDAHSIIAVTDARGVIIDVNDKFCQISRYQRSELIGKTHKLLNSGHHPPGFFAAMWQTITAGKVWKGEICNRTKDGSLYWVDSTIVPMLNGQGKPQRYIAIRTEVTPLKLAELALRERSQLAELNSAIGAALAHGGNLSISLEDCVNALVKHLELPFARIWTMNPEANLLELQAIAGQHSHTNDFHDRIPMGISIIGFIAQQQQPYLTNSAQDDWCIGANAWAQQERLSSFAGYPLVVEERLVGVLALFGRRPFSDMAQITLSSIASTVAVAIDRSIAREALLSRREALLFRLASQIRDSLNLDAILSTTVQEIRSLLKIDRCHFLWCWSNAELPEIVVTHESCDAALPSLLGSCPPQHLDILSQIILNLTMIRVDHLDHRSVTSPQIRELLEQSGATAMLLVPLETQSGQLGAIVCSHSSPRNWMEIEVELLQAVVDQVAIAIDQAELYAKTRAAAFAAETQAQQLSEVIDNLKQTQAQLIQTEKMSSLGQMIAGIAHEINNPVNFINGNLLHANNYIQDLLELIERYQRCYPEPVDEIQALISEIDLDFVRDDLPSLLESMKIGADRIRQIVLSLRNFSRLDEAEMKPVDIHEGIDNTLLILQSRLKASPGHNEIQVVKAYGEVPQVECYAGQLNQVFMNILANAIDALNEQPDPRIITITTEFVPREIPVLTTGPYASDEGRSLDIPTGVVIIRLRDNGCGMSSQTKEKLFDPFFTTKPVGQGTGLGMSISYQIVVQKHKGTLECISELDQGSEFVITIPSIQT